jgi:hypothetical protein
MNFPPLAGIGRGAFYRRRSQTVRFGGADRKANVGISNDNAGEKPAHRKTEDSPAMLISRGLVGT